MKKILRRVFWKIRFRYDFLKMYSIVRMFFRKLLLELKYSDDFNNLWKIIGNFRYYSMLFFVFFCFCFLIGVMSYEFFFYRFFN
ncbi:hypothetical protein GS16_01935 [Candidatus Liberibacter solanacearum]|nr:hypothetical protein GS16_01935 [Candidatus Liberibacter solanacearum]KJZ81441.1 hypothetical protein KP07_00720 [Candidatus Liberibacter solanacearum]KQC49078.1 hypothetical protein AP064_03185 [Candidatus Liberibacter solanacearum]